MDKKHIDTMLSFREEIMKMKKLIGLLHPENRGLVNKKERGRICDRLIKDYVLPMEELVLNLYIDSNKLAEEFKG